jgi:hypothetical protein
LEEGFGLAGFCEADVEGFTVYGDDLSFSEGFVVDHVTGRKDGGLAFAFAFCLLLRAPIFATAFHAT